MSRKNKKRIDRFLWSNADNNVPGHYRFQKQHGNRVKRVRNPGYSVRVFDVLYKYSSYRADWFSPFKPKPNKRKEKRRPSKP